MSAALISCARGRRSLRRRNRKPRLRADAGTVRHEPANREFWDGRPAGLSTLGPSRTDVPGIQTAGDADVLGPRHDSPSVAEDCQLEVRIAKSQSQQVLIVRDFPDALQRLSTTPHSRIAELTPWGWAAAR